MTDEQANNLIKQGRAAYGKFIEAKDAFQIFAAAYFNLEASTELTVEQFIGGNAGLDLNTFHEAFEKMAAVLQSEEVAEATKPVYQIGRQ